MNPTSLTSARAWAAALLLVLAGCGSDPDSHGLVGLPDFTELVRATAPSVVNISAAQVNGPPAERGETPQGDWLDRFFDDAPAHPPERPSLGSGFIISEDGYILTNRHVVSGANRIVVKLTDRRQFTAKLVGSDEYSDIALLKIEADDLQAVKIGSAKDLPVGSWVVAIGSPFGFETSVTAGIVSAKRRSLARDQYVPFIQTDVAINPGNSGGPLFNMRGEVVGVNAQIYSRSGGFQGVSFAIPIDVAMNVAKQLRGGGEVSRGWLGVQIQEVDLALAKSFGMQRPEGALVSQVLPGSPAEAAGLKAGDIILEFDGRAVYSAAALPPLVGLTAPGDTVEVVALRQGERETIEVTIGELDQDAPPGVNPDAAEPAEQMDLGMRLRDLRREERSELEIDGGVRVQEVQPGPAQEAGLMAGDVIVAVGAEPVAGVASLMRLLASAQGPVALRVLRGDAALYLVFDVPAAAG